MSYVATYNMTMLNKNPIKARFLSNSNGNDCPLPVALLPNGMTTVSRGQSRIYSMDMA